MDYGHYNAWPRTIIDTQLSGGYMDWGWGDEVAPGERFPALGHYLKSPAGIFAEAKDDPGYQPIVQINHVDSFFRDVGLGVDTGVEPAQSTVDPLSRRLDPAQGNLFSDNFDALELWIGESGTEAIGDEQGTIHENLADWFNLINQGVVRTGVASSDSHTSRLTALSTRSLVASGVTDPARLGRNPQALADNVADGRVVMTNAPFVRIEARNPDTGETASLAHDKTNEVSAPQGRVELEVRIESPVWAEFDRIDLFVNNAPEQINDDPARYRACEDRRITLDDSDIDRVEVVPGVDGAERLEAEVSVTMDELAGDTWIVARVAGTPGVSQSLFPVDPAGVDVPEDGELEDLVQSNVGQGGVMAYAITNPLFIDTDGGGWEPTGVRTDGECTQEG